MRVTAVALLVALAVLGRVHAHAEGPGLAESFRRAIAEADAPAGCFTRAFIVDEARCSGMRRLVRLGSALYLQSPEEFRAAVKDGLRRSMRLETYSYASVLMASISGDRLLAEDLRLVKEAESQNKMPHAYARLALERLSGRCADGAGNDAGSVEICRYDDPLFRRIVNLRVPSGRRPSE